MKRLRAHYLNLLVIAATSWISHYLHFTSFGLYGDDWYFQARPFILGSRLWFAELWTFFQHPSQLNGRPLQALFAYVFAGAGAATGSIAADYLIAYVLFTTSAFAMYAVLRHRYSPSFSVLACVIFVLTPLHTLHQFVNGQFICGPAFCLLFGAILLYFRGRHIWSCALAFLTLTAYESFFFPFLAAPLLLPGNQFRNRRRVWVAHLSRAAITLCLYVTVRKFVFPDPKIIDVSHTSDLIREVLVWWGRSTAGSFLMYPYAAFRAWEAPMEAYCWLVMFLVLLGALYKFNKSNLPAAFQISTDRYEWARLAVLDCVTGFIFMALGFTTAYFVFRSPAAVSPPVFYTDVETRVSVAATLGSSILVAGLLAGVLRLARSEAGRIAACGVVTVVLSVLFLYSFVAQLGYQQEWAEQRTMARQMIELSPDAKSDSVIVLGLKGWIGNSFFDRRRRFIGSQETMYEYVFPQVVAQSLPLPRMMMFYSDGWRSHLKRTSKGDITWSSPLFDGRWWEAKGEFKPGRLIVLEQWKPDRLVRRTEPILVDGEQIVQTAPCTEDPFPIWTLLKPNALPGFLPASAGRASVISASGAQVTLGSSFGIAVSPVTIHWDPVPSAEDYWIDVGTEVAKGNIRAGFTGKATSITVDLAAYLNGNFIHVQLYPKFKGVEPVPGTGTKYVLATVPRAR
jgi:hypothetical protein